MIIFLFIKKVVFVTQISDWCIVNLITEVYEKFVL